MPGLVPDIHVLAAFAGVKDVDGRDEPGHDASLACTTYLSRPANDAFRRVDRLRASG